MSAVATMPKRIQRKRSKGWKMPEGAIYVGRPTAWGNPFTGDRAAEWYKVWLSNPKHPLYTVRAFAATRGCNIGYVGNGRETAAHLVGRLDELRGHDLACWCKVGEACHADVLLELANAEPRP